MRFSVALAAWQASPEINSFSSKLDEALEYAKAEYPPEENPSGPDFPLDLLSDQENQGHDLFYANCTRFCHNSGPPFGTNGNRTDWDELYTNFGYFNIGTPANLEIPGYDPAEPDTGLMAHTENPAHNGQHKTPTMRNVDKRPDEDFTKAYTHNGWFKSLKTLVHFYNTRDVKEQCPEGITTEKEALAYDCWPAPEVADNVNSSGLFGENGLGDLGLTSEEEDAIVAYLKTLTDKYTVKQPKPYEK
jgi:cytochrome c peroxidase